MDTSRKTDLQKQIEIMLGYVFPKERLKDTKLMKLSSFSPDSNPIENLSIIKNDGQKDRYSEIYVYFMLLTFRFFCMNIIKA